MEMVCLQHNDAAFSLKNVLLRKLTYPLMVTSFTEQQCHLIMKLILKAGLPKAGVIHTYPRALVYGPSHYAGLDIPNLYMEQLVIQVCMVLCFGGKEQDTMAMLIQASVEALQLETG